MPGVVRGSSRADKIAFVWGQILILGGGKDRVEAKKLMCQKKNYPEVKQEEYKKLFGIGIDNSNDNSDEKNKTLEAYNRAWQNRDFEINKFWSRSAYFWGFIAAIFAGFIAVVTNEKEIVTNLDVFLVSLGLLFSVAWLLVIKGSKRWQENWESHIDQLEDDISGPLYKTVYRKGKTFYSVSKVNEILAWFVIIVWILLYLFHILQFDDILTEIIKKIIDSYMINVDNKRALSIFISLIGIITGLFFLLIKTRSDNTGYISAPSTKGEFITRC